MTNKVIKYETKNLVIEKKVIVKKNKFYKITQNLLQTLLREKYLLDILVIPQDKSIPLPLPAYFVAIFCYENNKFVELYNSSDKFNYVTYEEALEAGLIYALKQIKT